MGLMTSPRPPEILAQEAARKKRLAEALRENLKRRKAQARGRRAGETPPAAPGAPEQD